eukprot:SRR837773.1323.p2 GENE.SRR837773.1323~~SRR837773.1323.p2  ORF type:complete len:277 (-),score=60.39 SRR837773.1323:52-882(-)
MGGATAAGCKHAAALLQLFCAGDLDRSQNVVNKICERVEDSDGRALRSALRAGTWLVALADPLARERGVFLVKSVLYVARNNRRYFRTMHLVIHYLIKWCRRRPELPGWLYADGGGGHYRWLEGWLKDCIGNGGDVWVTNGYAGADAGRDARWAWCSEVLPMVRRIVRGEPPGREAYLQVPESDAELPGGTVALPGRRGALPSGTSASSLASSAASPVRRPPRPLLEPLLSPGSASTTQLELPVLSKAQLAATLAAQSRVRHDDGGYIGMRPLAAW